MAGSSGLATRFSRRTYVAAMSVLLLCLLALVIGSSISTYRSVRVQVEGELDERLLSMGRTIAQSLASGRLSTPAGRDSSDRLDDVRADLLQIAASSDLSGIEVIDSRRRHLVGTDETIPSGEKNPFLEAQPEVAVALAGIPATTALYETPDVRGTFFKTGFVPIEDAEGEVIGVVAVEGGSGFFSILPALRRIWWMAGIGSAVIAVVLGVFLLGVFRALERSESGLRASAALAAAGQLAAVVAHEIRNPLAALQSRAERAQEDLRTGADPARVADLLETIPLEVYRLDRIVTNYLSLARGAAGEGSCVVPGVVEETLELVAKDLERSSVRHSLSVTDPALRARIAPGPLRQALLNLFLNAREAMPEGGELNVRIRGETSWVVVEVEDTGGGIDPRVRRKIFEPFFTTRSTGSGLGLAIVDSILRSCGGRVDVRSEMGKGSTFVLQLPVEQKGAADAGPNEAV